jgi:predicted hydrolase (HD superfamily)
MNPTREQVLALVDKYSQATKQHLHQVWTIMEYFGQKLWQDSQYWWTVGILHDIDRDYIQKDGEKHLKEDFDKICDEINLSSEARADIRSHGHFLPWIQEKPDTLIRKYINAVDELSGFIWAYFRMIPSADVMEIKSSSIRKKLKDVSFAAWVDRGEALNCETMLGIPLEEFVEDIKLALKNGEWKK